MRLSKNKLLVASLTMAAALPAFAQDNSQDAPVSRDRSLLESTQPSQSIVPEPPAPGTQSGSALENWWNGDAASGNWFGLRNWLDDEGVVAFGSYEANIVGNPVGGRARGFVYADNFDFGVRLQLEKLIGWKGATITVEGADRNGNSLTSDYIGNFFQTQQLFGVQTFMFYGLYLEQKLFDDLVSIKAGRFATNEDFATSPIYGLYMGNGIDGNPKTLVASGAFSSYPGSVWAARVKVKPTKETNVSLGIYQTNDRLYDGRHHGFDWSFRSNDGMIIIGQMGWSPELFKRPVGGDAPSDGKSIADGKSGKSFSAPVEMKGLPGNYWFGAYASIWQVPQFGSGNQGNGPYGFYWHADQMVFQESPGSSQGLTVWGDLVYQPDPKVNIIPFQINAGLVYKGLIPLRDEDVTIFGFTYGQFSSDYARTVRSSGQGYPSYEIVFEAGYRIQLTKFAYLMPDLQYIVNPGGTGTIPNALVTGLRVGVTF